KYFANSTKYIDVIHGRLRLSSLLRWYAKDFEQAGGVGPFLSQYITVDRRFDADDVKGLLAKELNKAEYVYDWTVNDRKNKAVKTVPLAPTPLDQPPDAMSTSRPSLDTSR